MRWGAYIPGDHLAAPADPREARLPMWAQRERAALRERLSDADRRAEDQP